MKTNFIRINDISEINPGKATAYDLNNRYIDAKGNMYGLKYNREKKRMEVIRLIRTAANAAGFYQKKVIENKRIIKSGMEEEDNYLPDVGHVEEEDNAPKQTANGESPFEPEKMIVELMDTMSTHRERLNAIVVNINNTPIMTGADKDAIRNLHDIFRNVDIDGIQRIEKVIELHKEMTSYPRSVNYYLGKLDTKSKKIVDDLVDESVQMRYIYVSEVYHPIRQLYRTIQKMLNDFYQILDEIKIDDIKSMTVVDRQHIADAKTSIQSTVSEIETIHNQLHKIEGFLANPFGN